MSGVHVRFCSNFTFDKQYVAYVILAYEREEEPAAFLVQLTEVWLAYLLYPGEYVSLHSNDSCLWRS